MVLDAVRIHCVTHFLYLYTRWYLLRSRHRCNHHNRRTHIIFYVDPSTPSAVSRELDASVLQSLPFFTSSFDAQHDGPLKCVVCLSEFEDDEKARLLPKCGHGFHIYCIDMWFQSHATCSLYRSPVELPETSTAPLMSVTPSTHFGTSLILGLCSDCQCEESAGPSSSRSKPQEFVGVRIEVPRRAEFNEESASDSSASQYRSPMCRMMSFMRIQLAFEVLNDEVIHDFACPVWVDGFELRQDDGGGLV